MQETGQGTDVTMGGTVQAKIQRPIASAGQAIAKEEILDSGVMRVLLRRC